MPALIYSMGPVKMGSTVYACKSIGLSAGVVEGLEFNSGIEYPSLHKISGAAPRIVLSMPFAHAYAAIGLSVTSLTTLEIFLAQFVSLIRSASSVHTKWALSSSATAAAQIVSFGVDQDGDLMAQVEIFPLAADSTLHPLTRTDANALPALSAQPALYTLGPVSINGTVIAGLSSAGGELGHSLTSRRSDGDLYPRIAAHVGGAPKLSFEHADPVTLGSTIGLLGVSLSSTLISYFKAYNATTGLVGLSNGLSITVTSGRVTPTELPVSQGEVARQGFEVSGLSTSSTHPWTISTSATVPTVS